MTEAAPRRIYPQRLQNAFMQVGEPDVEFRPSKLNLCVRVVLGFLIAAAGLGVGAIGLFDGEDLFECLIGGVVLVGIGLVMAWTMWSIWGQRLMVCPGGLVRKRGLRVSVCPWQHIKSIIQTEGKSAYTIVVAQGDPWEVDYNHTPAIDELGQRLRDLAQKHSVPWSVKKEEKKDD